MHRTPNTNLYLERNEGWGCLFNGNTYLLFALVEGYHLCKLQYLKQPVTS